jgi:hypothetical protein
MADENLIQALAGIRIALGGSGGAAGDIDFPRLGAGPLETVLVFNSNEHIEVRDFPAAPYFSARGVLTDLGRGGLPDSEVERAFPIVLSALPGEFRWPPPQQAPFDGPPVEGRETIPPGPSKQAYFFADGSSLVTVGPSLPKVAALADGGAHYWVSSIGVVAQGTGRFAGARGLAATLVSAFFERWPAGEEEQSQLLLQGFHAAMATCFKLVLEKDLAGEAPAAPRQATAPQPPAAPAASTARAATDQPPPRPASKAPAAPAPAPQPPAPEAPAPQPPAPKPPPATPPAAAPKPPAPKPPAPKAPARKAPARKAPARKSPAPKPTPRNRP